MTAKYPWPPAQAPVTKPLSAPVGGPVPALFVHYGEDWIRGSETVLLDLLRHLDRSRIRPIAWCNSPKMAEAVRALEVPAFLGNFECYFQEGSPPFSLTDFRKLVQSGIQMVADHHIHLIHANSAAPNQWMLPVARTARVPLLTHLHIDYLRRSRYTLGLHQASLAVGVSRRLMEDLWRDGMPRERTEVIYNGIDPARLEADARGNIREMLGLPAHAVVITAICSLIHRKGVDVLLDAFQRLLQYGEPEPHLLLVGDGSDRAKLEQQTVRLGIGDHVRFLGTRRDVGSILSGATDILALASRAEGLPLVIAEAGFLGVPAVAASVGGVPELVLDGVTGLVVPPENPDAFACALRSLAQDPEKRSRMGAAARERVSEKFVVSRMIHSFHETYDRLLAQPQTSLGWTGKWNGIGPYLRALEKGPPA